MSFLTKVRALTLGAAHDLLDKAVDLNSPSLLRQYVRDLEGAIDKLKSEAAIQDGQLRTTTREIGELDSKIKTDKETIAKLLSSTDPTAAGLARTKASLVVQEQQHLDQMHADQLTQQNVSASMQQGLTALEAKHADMVSRVRELERLDRDSKSKEQAATAITNAGKIASMGSDGSVDDLTDRMNRRHDVADARFDQAVGSMHVDAPDSSDVEALLNSLKPAEAVAQ